MTDCCIVKASVVVQHSYLVYSLSRASTDLDRLYFKPLMLFFVAMDGKGCAYHFYYSWSVVY